jgi:hypothetical protein
MPPPTTIDDPRQLRRQIESLVERLGVRPLDLELHQQLRETALRHKVAGGRDVGLLERMRRVPRDPLRRLLHVERLWSFDPGNTERFVRVVQAFEAHAVKTPDLDVEPVRRWLNRLFEAMRAGA